ncbi:MAG: DUF4340 domain-containing protein [Deltaproteobacteria bacterium]|nr:DUF4340 domain-containing protein [Deltaproteobacteria bacterium]MBW2419190.1 DUF4340 domain-containing protein [Deltaproteobacteria bacterium]
MNPRTTGLLALAAALLGAFVYFYEIRGGDRRERVEEASRRIFPEVEASEIDLLDLSSTEGVRARALREQGRWLLVEPLDFPGDTVALDGIAGSLAQLTSESAIESPREPGVYGLGEGARRLAFRAGEERHELVIGKQTPVGESTYVARGAQPERVLTVATWRIDSLSHGLDELRDRRVLVFDRGAVDELVIRWPGSEIVLAKRADGWWIRKPAGAGRADDPQVENLLSDLSFLRAEGFVDEPRPAEEAGLEEPAFELLLRIGKGVEGAGERAAQGRELRFALGSAVEDRQRLALGKESGVLYRVDENRISDLPRDFFAYRFKTLSSFVLSEISAVEIDFRPEESAGQSPAGVRLERDAVGVWHGSPLELREGVAARLVAELAQLEGVSIVADAMGPEELAAVGLAPPGVILRAYAARGPEAGVDAGAALPVAEVHLGHSDPERGAIAKAPDRDTIYRIDPVLSEQIPVSHEAFMSRFVANAADEIEGGGSEAGGD